MPLLPRDPVRRVPDVTHHVDDAGGVARSAAQQAGGRPTGNGQQAELEAGGDLLDPAGREFVTRHPLGTRLPHQQLAIAIEIERHTTPLRTGGGPGPSAAVTAGGTTSPRWPSRRGSASQLDTCASTAELCINPIDYAEVSVGVARIEGLDGALPHGAVTRPALHWEAGFLAGKAFLRQRRAQGSRTSPLPATYIGAHAAVGGMALLTRFPTRYRTHYPTLELICP